MDVLTQVCKQLFGGKYYLRRQRDQEVKTTIFCQGEKVKRMLSKLKRSLSVGLVSVAIHDSLSSSPTFIEHEDPEMLTQLFVEELERRQALVVRDVEQMYPRPEDFDMLPKRAQEAWNEWVNLVAVIGFDSGKYDINMIEEFFVERIAENVDEKKKWLRRTIIICF